MYADPSVFSSNRLGSNVFGRPSYKPHLPVGSVHDAAARMLSSLGLFEKAASAPCTIQTQFTFVSPPNVTPEYQFVSLRLIFQKFLITGKTQGPPLHALVRISACRSLSKCSGRIPVKGKGKEEYLYSAFWPRW